jgi:hypothetical protein
VKSGFWRSRTTKVSRKARKAQVLFPWRLKRLSEKNKNASQKNQNNHLCTCLLQAGLWLLFSKVQLLEKQDNQGKNF